MVPTSKSISISIHKDSEDQSIEAQGEVPICGPRFSLLA